MPLSLVPSWSYSISLVFTAAAAVLASARTRAPTRIRMVHLRGCGWAEDMIGANPRISPKGNSLREFTQFSLPFQPSDGLYSHSPIVARPTNRIRDFDSLDYRAFHPRPAQL